MLVLITYDVNTQTGEGRRRLQKVAKTCLSYGQRVQNSVFECELDAALLLIIKDKLLNIIDLKVDSLRFYVIGNNRGNVEHYGAKETFDLTAPIVL
jgi:CRISPR-associated protein Cas2